MSEQPEAIISNETEVSSSIHEMTLLYCALFANQTSWPLKRFTITYESTNSYIFYCSSLMNSETYVCFSRSLLGIPHPVESYSNFKLKACIYSNSYAPHRSPQDNVPKRCLLQPEHSLSYNTPRLYYRSRNYSNNYKSAHYLKNYFIQLKKQEDINKLAHSSMQIHYNIHLPNDKSIDSAPKFTNCVELRPKTSHKTRNTEGVGFDVEATIEPLSIDEEMLAYNSLDDINNIDINIHDTSRYIFQAEHETHCYSTKIPCPFLFTQCDWFESVPLVARHIRQMHAEKIVSKKTAEYYINFYQLEMLKDRGVKIIQEYNNRLCYISLCYYSEYIFITIQELCESVEQHVDRIKVQLIVRHQSGVRTWKGKVHSMHIPLSHLWKKETAIILPIQYLKTFQSKHFRLQVEIGI